MSHQTPAILSHHPWTRFQSQDLFLSVTCRQKKISHIPKGLKRMTNSDEIESMSTPESTAMQEAAPPCMHACRRMDCKTTLGPHPPMTSPHGIPQQIAVSLPPLFGPHIHDNISVQYKYPMTWCIDSAHHRRVS